jgi:hypothetical protein
LGALFDLLGSLGTLFLSFTKDVTEEEIAKNIKFLQEYEWFQEYLNDIKFENLISEHKDVRYVIGKFDTEKMRKNTEYRIKYQKKIQKVILENAN